ncbi:T9SS type A sorting domain-containing protein [Chitinophagaceae bacterium MMS25-I14]
MKRSLFALLLVAGAITEASAYNTVTVKDSISTNTHWTNNQQYLLKGYVYVTAGATLTIDSGCIIKGDKATKGALIVERGAKLMAIGTATAPIVFTSNQPAGSRSYGDWGGIILCGKAPNNWNGGQAQVEGGPRSLYGGTDPHDNSGQMSYVRIEFPGIAFSPNNEVNGLTFCSVGDATQIDHIQVSYSGDDSYEWFGGTVNTKNLIAFRTWDDDFDTDNGYNGKNQFMISLRDPNIADQSGSKAFESDSYQNGTATGLSGDTSQITKPVFSNCTVIGPLLSPTTTSYDPQYVSAAHIRRGSAISILNSIIAGYPAGVLIDESAASFGSTSANIANGILQFRNNIICGIPNSSFQKEVMYVKDGARSLTSTAANADTVTGNPFNPFAGPFTWLNNGAYGNKVYANEQNGVRLQSPFSLTAPDFRPTSTSPIAYNTKGNGSATAGSFNPANPINYDTTGNYANYNVPQMAPSFAAASKASDAFFTKVNYVGAFSGTGSQTDNWIATWTNWDPNNTDYNSYVNSYHGAPTSVGGLIETVESATVYPNPAGRNATLMMVYNGRTTTDITLLDITGKLVKTIAVNNTQAAGIQNINIDLNDVNAGIYIVSIRSGNTQKSIKLSVIK